MTEKTYLTVPVTKEQIEAFYRAAFNAGLEAAAKVCDETDVERTNYCMNVYEEGDAYKANVLGAIRALEKRP